MRDSPCVELENLSAGYDSLVLSDVTLEVPYGALFGIIGPNGAGKSTLLKVISGLLEPFKGELSVLGRNISTRTDRLWLRRQIGYLAQMQVPGQLPMTVAEAVLLGRWGRYFVGFKRPSSRDYQQVEWALNQVGMADYQNRDLRQLSGGQRQRVALARAIVREPELLLMDEPTTYLDIKAQCELIELIRMLQQKLGITTLVVTHLTSADWGFSDTFSISDGKLSRWSA